MHRLVSPPTGPAGLVIGIDHLSGLNDLARTNMLADGIQLGLSTGPEGKQSGVDIVTGDGRNGYPSCAPYDAIHVGAAAPTLPIALVNQLNSPGRLFIPIGTYEQDVWQVDKDAQGDVTKKKLFGVRVSATGPAHVWSAQVIAQLGI